MLNIAMVGCDTSHAVHFTRILNDAADSAHIAGAKVVAAIVGGEGTIKGSRERAEANAKEIAGLHKVPFFETISDLPRSIDAIFIEGTDGAGHLAQVAEAAPFGVPIFVDKPLALDAGDAAEIFRLAEAHNVPLMSSSALRYDSFFREALESCGNHAITAASIHAPMTFVEGCPGYFWYGIHSAEMLFAAMGPGLREVRIVQQEKQDVIIGVWEDGRMGVIHGTRAPHFAFGGTLHTAEKPVSFHVPEGGVPFYTRLLAQVVEFIKTGRCPIPREETLDIIRFLGLAEEQRMGEECLRKC